MLAVLATALALVYPLDPKSFGVLQRDSGPVNYYRVVESDGLSFIRGIYEPGLETVTLFRPLPDQFRRGPLRLRWRWRAIELPAGGNECAPGRGDSAAAVYVTWKRGLRWYSVKLIWSSEAKVGVTCNQIRNPFVASDSVVLRSGGGGGSRWEWEEVDVEALYRQHFGDDIPELQGIGLLTDGDQTKSVSAADYADFTLTR